MPKPKKHVFICTNQRPEGHPRGSCSINNAMGIWQKFADILNTKQLYNDILISGVRSCMGPCSLGPVVVIYPDNVWYGKVTDSDVEEIFQSHLIDGNPVERLVLADEVIG